MDDEKLAYWLGVMQSDGCMYVRKRPDVGDKNYITLGVGPKSIEMLEKFSQYCFDLFERSPKIFYDKINGNALFRMSAETLLEFFVSNKIEFSDPPKPPEFITSELKLFGAYLAGVIDGDGDIRIKRKKYPQCIIRITSGSPQVDLANSLREKLKCSVSITKYHRVSWLKERRIEGSWCSLEFCASKRNLAFIREFLIPHIAVSYKRQKLEKFIENRYALAVI